MKKGIARNIRVKTSLGHGLDEEAVIAAYKWRFRPAIRGGCAIRVPAEIEMKFKLAEEEPAHACLPTK